MVSRQHDRGVLVKILFLHPSDKGFYLPGGTCQHVSVLVIAKLAVTQVTDPAILKMSIYGQQSQVKGFLLPRKFCQLLLRKLKQLLILISPPDFIALRDPSLLQGIVIVFDLKIPVLLVHQLSAAKDGLRSDQQGLRISFLFQNVSKRRYLGKEMLLRIHGIFFDRYGKGQPGRLGKHRRDRPGLSSGM